MHQYFPNFVEFKDVPFQLVVFSTKKGKTSKDLTRVRDMTNPLQEKFWGRGKEKDKFVMQEESTDSEISDRNSKYLTRKENGGNQEKVLIDNEEKQNTTAKLLGEEEPSLIEWPRIENEY